MKLEKIKFNNHEIFNNLEIYVNKRLVDTIEKQEIENSVYKVRGEI